MFRTVVMIFFACVAGVATAEDTRLKRLDTGDDSRGWEAVGRLDIGGKGFCTGALIAPDLVLTAAHCLYDSLSGAQINHEEIEFLAGWRNGRASAYRWVRRAVVHPEYVYNGKVSADRVRNDVALLELHHPIRNTTVVPFATDQRPKKGDRIGVVSYARERSEAPSMQEACRVMARQSGMLIMSCEADFGSSGAPVFSFQDGVPRIVSVVSAKAEVAGHKVSLGTQLEGPLAVLKAALAQGQGAFSAAPAPRENRITVGTRNSSSGAKFIKN
ncbi:trypsin-like serine peptidase [Marimonas arenosa]|uniref:Trypsin-like peptidase domain-containing protein n=1 Tax=Marimonas arenosa TaxID=1795305 RepID=A0AAE3WC35_9RHOB|nr:trypsin-like peptidase domain-containing protein [Marimonas arenosa]MDQ2090481.1 trypsin-like peptidase domain-containing protein [Marimonas arenosa]